VVQTFFYPPSRDTGGRIFTTKGTKATKVFSSRFARSSFFVFFVPFVVQTFF